MIYKRSSQRNLFPNYECIFYTLLFIHLQSITFPNLVNLGKSSPMFVGAVNSINYGITQQVITDVNQLMPKLCQNQSVICEGSFCIPNIRRCVCDLRMPVQFGRYCLRQIDIETKCFATSQCNHTVKDAVCLEINSNNILDAEASKFKLDQWQQLNELRQLSQSATANKVDGSQSINSDRPKKFVSIVNSSRHRNQNNVIFSNVRNSPYEINYNTPELLLQNHTRRRTNNSDRSIFSSISPTRDTRFEDNMLPSMTLNDIPSPQTPTTTTTTTATTTTVNSITTNQPTTPRSQNPETRRTATTYQSATERSSPVITTTTYSEQVGKKKVIKTPNWPPGVCSCPPGFMFDSMLRKCLALSLTDSHCSVDSDCRQIAMTHCSSESKRCDCDEPLEWSPSDMACIRPKLQVKTGPSSVEREAGSFLDSLIPPMVIARYFPDHMTLLIIFVVLVILGTLIILKLTVKCFSSSSSALISPQVKRKKTANNHLPPKSPYATLRRPEHKPSSQLSNFAQMTRGRILNYDFEEENENEPAKSPAPSQKAGKTGERAGTSKVPASHKHQTDRQSKSPMNVEVEASNQFIELNDNISVSQMESESKSDNSIPTIPGPSPNQPPPYMLASAMKGQGSAIAAAAAAVANKRMQLAQKKNLEQQQQASRHSNKDPVFL